MCSRVCVYDQRVNLWSSSLGLGELCKAGLAEGCSVPHLQHTVPHHLCKHGGPELVKSLALQVGVWRPLDQLLEVLLYCGSSLRRLHSALLCGKDRSCWFSFSDWWHQGKFRNYLWVLYKSEKRFSFLYHIEDSHNCKHFFLLLLLWNCLDMMWSLCLYLHV